MGNTTIEAQNYCIYFNEEGTRFINDLIAERRPSKLFLLVDSHTNEHCLPVFLPDLATDIPLEIIEIEAGEPNKPKCGMPFLNWGLTASRCSSI